MQLATAKRKKTTKLVALYAAVPVVFLASTSTLQGKIFQSDLLTGTLSLNVKKYSCLCFPCKTVFPDFVDCFGLY